MSILSLIYDVYGLLKRILRIVNSIYALSTFAGERLVKSPGRNLCRAFARPPEQRARNKCDCTVPCHARPRSCRFRTPPPAPRAAKATETSL